MRILRPHCHDHAGHECRKLNALVKFPLQNEALGSFHAVCAPRSKETMDIAYLEVLPPAGFATFVGVEA